MNYILGRLREPSTYAGIAAILAAFNINIEPNLWGMIVQICIGVAGAIAAVTPDRSAGQAVSFADIQTKVTQLTRKR